MFVRSRKPCARPSVLSKVSNIIGVFSEARVLGKYNDFYCIIVFSALDSKTNRDRVRRSRMFQNGKSVSEAVVNYCEDEDFS